MTEKNQTNQTKTSSNSLSLEEQFHLLEILTEDTNFQILTILLIYQEMTLSQINEKLQKSRATIHRHLQDLENHELVKISKEEIIRGPIPAKFYQPNLEKISQFKVLQNPNPETLSPKEYLQFKKAIVQSTITSASLIRNYLKILQDLLMDMDITNTELFNKLFNLEDSPITLGVHLTSNSQRELFIKRYREFMLKFTEEIKAKNLIQTEEQRPHVNITGMINMKLLFNILNEN